MSRRALQGASATLLLGLFAAVALAQSDGPSTRLARTFPDLFPASTLADAALGGELGVRLLAPTDAQAALGLQANDIVLRVGGHPVDSAAWEESAAPSAGTSAVPGPGFLVVWRAVPGERPVLSPAVLGRRVTDEFVALPDSQWAPMRLAVMLANQQTLVDPGGGVLLLPAADFDPDLWLQRANPLPRISEVAIATVADAIVRRTSIPPETVTDELAAARQHLAQRQYLEAGERARRAMVGAVVSPELRADGTTLVEATRVYASALQEQQRTQAQLLSPEPNFAFVVEGMINRIQEFIPQKTLLAVESSTGGVFLAGVRVRAPTTVPVLSDLFLLVEYGVVKNSFEASDTGGEALSTTLQQIGFEVLYRPRVASRLKPFLRGGVGIFPFTAKVPCSDENAIDELEVGALLGGGIDFLRVPSLHLRCSVAGSYRIVHSKFLPEEAPLLESCSNADVTLEDGFYDFDLDGWQVGLMLTFDL